MKNIPVCFDENKLTNKSQWSCLQSIGLPAISWITTHTAGLSNVQCIPMIFVRVQALLRDSRHNDLSKIMVKTESATTQRGRFRRV